MKNRITKLVAAAMIVFAVFVGLSQFSGSVNVASMAFAQMTETVKKMPWLHVVLHEYRGDSEKREEYWYSFERRMEANRKDDGQLRFYDYANNEAYVYTPSTEEITISRFPEVSFALGAGSPWEFLGKAIDAVAKDEGAVTQQTGQYEGMNVEIFKITVSKGQRGTEEWEFVADKEKNLLVILKIKGYDLEGNVTGEEGEFYFDYPDVGPNNIYEVGAPRSVKVIDNRIAPSGIDVIKTYYAYRENVPSRYVAVVTKSYRDEVIGLDVITGADVIYADGQLRRIEQYSVSDTSVLLENWPKHYIEMGETLDSLLRWWTQSEQSECTHIKLYDGEYNYTISYDKEIMTWVGEPRQHSTLKGDDYSEGVADLGWPKHGLYLWTPDLPPIMVVENKYSNQNNLICLQSLQQGKVRKDSVQLPSKKLWYFNPQCDYICQRFEEHYLRNAPWQEDKAYLEGVEPNRIAFEVTSVTQVTSFGQTEARQWYPKRIEVKRSIQLLEENNVDLLNINMLVLEGSIMRKVAGDKGWMSLNILTVYINTDPNLPDRIFEPESLPERVQSHGQIK